MKEFLDKTFPDGISGKELVEFVSQYLGHDEVLISVETGEIKIPSPTEKALCPIKRVGAILLESPEIFEGDKKKRVELVFEI